MADIFVEILIMVTGSSLSAFAADFFVELMIMVACSCFSAFLACFFKGHFMTIEENIAVVPELIGWKKDRIRERVTELLEMVGLDPEVYRHRRPKELSGGQQQRVGVIRALAADPDILLMDEPFSALDPISRMKLQDDILELQRSIEKTIVFVTHDLQEAFKLGDRVCIMNDGRIEQLASPQEILNGCMVRSMDGQKFADDDEDLDAMVAYLTYISEGIPVGAELEWRHQNSIDDLPTPDVANGEKLYQQSCVACHGDQGQGTGSNTGPKLWGEGSFNDGAGIARMTKMAGYIRNNMPVGQENTLSDQEASDLAAYVLSHDRPEWKNHDKDWPNGGRPNDIMNKERRDQIKDGTINWDEVLATPEKK